MYKIAVCIPCASKDIKYLKACIGSVKAQTRQPDFVIVSISSIENEGSLDLPDIEIPIEYIYSKGLVHPGGNRNLAAKKAVEMGADLLTFFDADDIMHPRKIEETESHFMKHPEITAFLHSYLTGPKGDMRIYEGKIAIPWQPLTGEYIKSPFHYYTCEAGGGNCLLFINSFMKSTSPGYGYVHNAHMTVKASFWKDHPYSEIKGPLGYCEDTNFSASIITSGLIIGYTPDMLSLYQRIEYSKFTIGGMPPE
jgi:glycosyltransferase involved in cell wall biosynthesis